ncbi:MAG TPA: polyhydroxyalkanoic acid system family protein [Allosphingosinicella sp.]|nr:polyhydroxyalkanoic acid system family protein [Allosphingosinicella sp.]
MAQPTIVDLPHRLGADEARRRIAGGIGKLTEHLPPGAEVSREWSGNVLNLRVSAIGQEVVARIEAMEAIVRVEMTLPAALSFFTRAIEAAVRRKGADMLEDKSGGAKG